MNCMLCNGKTRVYNRRTHKNGKEYRGRRCNECGHEFRTYEVNQFTLLDAFDNHLPDEAVDRLADILEIEFPELIKERRFPEKYLKQAKENGIGYQTFRTRVLRYKWDLDRASTAPILGEENIS